MTQPEIDQVIERLRLEIGEEHARVVKHELEDLAAAKSYDLALEAVEAAAEKSYEMALEAAAGTRLAGIALVSFVLSVGVIGYLVYFR